MSKTATKTLPVGMGAIPYEEGIAFRVWAPHADEVYVMGSFNEWSEEEFSLHREQGGYWAGSVPTAKVGDEYKFLIINGDQRLPRNDPYARELTHSLGNSIIVDPDFDWEGDDFRLAPWNELVIYEMHIGAFNHEPDTDAPGTFDSAREKLQYLRDLGVNLIQLMPVHEFPGDFSWGYNASHLFAVESSYGGPQALKRFVKAAHELGIGVMADVVYNHIGPHDVDLWRFDGWYENDAGGIYFYGDWRRETPWGDTRFDYGRPEVRQYIHDNAMTWIKEFHMDGLRWDSTLYTYDVRGNTDNPETRLEEGWELMRWINKEIHEHDPRHLTAAEELRNNDRVTETLDNGGAGFGTQWAAEFVYPIREVLLALRDEDRDMEHVAAAISHSFNSDAFKRVIYTESHDVVAEGEARVPEEIYPGEADHLYAKKRSTLGAGIVFTTPGIPMIFQGQEILEDGWFKEREPLDWSRQERFLGVLQMYRDLAALRRNLKGNTQGLMGQKLDIYHLNKADNVIAYHRWDEGGPGDSVVIVANFSADVRDDYTVGLPAAGEWGVRLNSDAKHYDPEFGGFGPTGSIEAEDEAADEQLARVTLQLPAYSVLILSQDPES